MKTLKTIINVAIQAIRIVEKINLQLNVSPPIIFCVKTAAVVLITINNN